MIDKERLHFAESLGDNCEFGFVLSMHDYDGGSVFRWAYSPFDAMIKTVESDFEGVFQFDNLVSLNGGMVTDTLSGISFHSKMVSIREDRKMRFVDDAEIRRPIYDIELSKINYLITKFRTRLNKPNITYFLRNRYSLADDELRRACDVLARRRDASPFKLVYIQETDQMEKRGTVEDRGNSLFVGYVGWIAPVSNADHADFESWAKILDRTLPYPSLISTLHKTAGSAVRKAGRWTRQAVRSVGKEFR